MKFIGVARSLVLLLFCLICSDFTLAQTKPLLKQAGSFGFAENTDFIKWDKYLSDKNQLLLIGRNTVQLVDFTAKNVIYTRSIVVPSPSLTIYMPWQISPDGKRMLIVGHRDARIGKKQAAWIWDLETGKRIAVLDQMPTNVRMGWWSANGKTLVTLDQEWSPYFTRKLNVTFWDGESFLYRETISIENVTWLHLSDDGERFFAASGRPANLLGIKYVSDKNGIIYAWSASTGEFEKSITVSDTRFTPKTRDISISPDDRFLLFIKKHKTNSAETRLLAWEMNGSVEPKYELKPQPKIDDTRLEFSPDGKYFALDVGKNLQIYETATGRKLSELENVELPDGWLNDNVLLRVQYKSKSFFKMGKMLSTYDAANGMTLYSHRLEYEETTTTGISDDDKQTETIDDTTVLRNPRKNLFVTQSNYYLKLFDSRTGKLMQTVIAPAVVYDKNNKPKLKFGERINRALWSDDGKTLCVFSSNLRSVTLWELVEN